MTQITATARDLALAACVRARTTAAQLATWAEAGTDRDVDERGSSTETVILIAGFVLLAIAVVAIFTKKVLDKANSINF